MTPQFVSYLRVSTVKQAESGHGIEVQRRSIASYVESCGGIVLSEFAETASGSTFGPPELTKALRAAIRFDAAIIVSHVDRLTRNSEWFLRFLEMGVPVVSCEMPNATAKDLSFAVVSAERERRVLCDRVKAGISVARSNGVKLGRPPGPGKPIKVTAEIASQVLLLKSQQVPIARIARAVGLSRPTVYSILA